MDVPDLPQHREFFREFKKTLKIRFEQLEILLVEPDRAARKKS